MPAFNPTNRHFAQYDPQDEPELERIARLYGGELADLEKSGEISPALAATIERLDRAAHNEMRAEFRSIRPFSAIPRHRFSTAINDITREQLVQSFIERTVLHEWFFQTPEGHRKFGKISRSKLYHVFRSNRKLALKMPPRMENGRRYLSIGGGLGVLDAELMRANGRDEKRDVRLIDRSKRSHRKFETLTRRNSHPDTEVRCFDPDFLNFKEGGMWMTGFFESEIRATNDNTPISATAYNVFGNPVIPQDMRFLLAFRPYFHADDEFDISFDCTRDEDLIRRTYGLEKIKRVDSLRIEYEGWFKEGLRHLWEKQLGLTGINWTQIWYNGDVIEEPFNTVHLHEQSRNTLNAHCYMQVGRHRPPGISKELREYLNGPGEKYAERFHAALSDFAGSRHGVLDTRRHAVGELEQMFRVCNYKILQKSSESDLSPKERSAPSANGVIFRIAPSF